ncbi:MAG: class I SAM-dependent methyltransferase [Planctomycetota bacterium]
MSGFDAAWLALRERADDAARSAATARFVDALTPRAAELRVLDLGAGSGNNAAHLAPRIGARADLPQRWTLVDDDAALLERAASRVRAIEGVSRVDARVADLATGLSDLALGDVDVVTATALFDLASAAWIDRCADAIAGAGVPAVLAALTVDGRVEWTPKDPLDARASELFHSDMERDKGLGVALGGGAADALVAALSRRGYACEVVDSAWRLGADDGALQRRYLEDVADVIEPSDERARVWRERRRTWIEEGASRLLVGHSDVLALRDA